MPRRRDMPPMRHRSAAPIGDDVDVERKVDFNRAREMTCGHCRVTWVADLEWIDRWNSRQEGCPGCGTTCEADDAAQITASPDDPLLDQQATTQIVWYHTSTHLDWPRTDIDWEAGFDQELRQMMGGEEAVAKWAAGQNAKALHIGSYESAIHNMMRRMSDQGDRGKQFYLYRVRLRDDAVVGPRVLPDSSNWVGDVHLDEICAAEVEACRYVNHHEDPGGLSLAIRPSAIASTQRLPIPLTSPEPAPWIGETIAQLSAAEPDTALPEGFGSLAHVAGKTDRENVASTAASALAGELPINLRDQFGRAATWQRAQSEPEEWAHYVFGLAAPILKTDVVLAELDAQPPRTFPAETGG